MPRHRTMVFQPKPELAAAYWELYKQGFSCEQIAKAHGCRRASVWYLLQAHGYELRAKKQLPFVIFNGNKYTANTNGYYRRTVRDRHYSLHRDIWECHNGKIPDGYDIHHINGNKQDNRIENLECISKAEHSRQHGNGKATQFKGRAVRRLDTCEEYESVKSAGLAVGIAGTNITTAIKRGGKCAGIKWEYV